MSWEAGRKWGLWVFLLMAVLLVFGCGIGEKAQHPNKKVVVGLSDYPTFSYIDENGKPAGIDVALAKEAFGRMGYEAEILPIDWDEKDKLLESGEIDCIWSCFTMNGREDLYQWAGPYVSSRLVVAVNADSAIYRLADLEGKTLAVQTHTKPERIFTNPQGNTPQLKQLYSLPDRNWVYIYLSQGLVDAIAVHETTFEQYMKSYGPHFRILDDPVMVSKIGVAFSLNDKRGIAGELQQVMDTMRRDGTTEEILSQYVDEPKKYVEGW